MKILPESATSGVNYQYSSLKTDIYSERQFLESAKKLAFEITGRLEGGRANSIQLKDSGIISYGKHQATLQSGALYKVIDYYTAISDTKVSTGLSLYLDQLEAKSTKLKSDKIFLGLLEQASHEPHMELAQDKVFSDQYWIPSVNVAKDLGLKSQIGYAIIYDTKVQGGLDRVLDRTLSSFESAEVTEMEFLEEMLLQRQDYLNSVAKAKRASGDKVTAKLLENAAKNRIEYLQYRLTEDYF